MPYKIVGRGVVAQHSIEERGNQEKNNKNHYWHGNSYAVDVVAMMTMVVVYFIVTVETRAGKMVKANPFHQSRLGFTLHTTLYAVE